MKILKFLFVLLLLCTMLSTAKAQKQQMINGEFVHTVFFWLKNPDNHADQDAFLASLKKFITSSAYVKSKHLGTPANTNRDVIDNTYTYCLILTFDNKVEQDKYQEEDVHKIFIEESSGLWEKVLVYDSENIW